MRTILVKRKPGGAYYCTQCGAALTHDQAYKHAQFDCPKKVKGLGRT